MSAAFLTEQRAEVLRAVCDTLVPAIMALAHRTAEQLATVAGAAAVQEAR